MAAETAADVEAIIASLDDELVWEPLGGNPNNYGVIAAASDPFDGIAERITNAIDACVELAVEQRPELKGLTSPRAAVEAIFGIKEGVLKNCPDRLVGELASKIKVRFLDSGEPKRPTVEVWDKGIGQHPSEFPDTLMSLNKGYKVTKFYLIGAFGQGGQTTFRHARYGLVVSRRHPGLVGAEKADAIGWTIVRSRDPSSESETFKIERWEYCLLKGTGQVPTIPAAAVHSPFEHGTMVRLIAYDLPKGTGDVLQPNSTAWSFLSQTLFDPPLPFRLFEGRRDRYKERNQPVAGLARRLWQGGKGEKATIEHAATYRLEFPSRGSVLLHYWTLTPTDENERWPDVRKNFVSSATAVYITVNGQRHGIETTRFLRDHADLPFAADYVIVQADCDSLTNRAKKELFPSTRDRLNESGFKDELMEEIAGELREDRNLRAFEDRRKQSILASKLHRDTSRIKRMVGQFIQKNPEVLAHILGQSAESDDSEKRRQASSPSADAIRDDEIKAVPLLDVPSYLKITNARTPILIEKGGNALVRLETDARDDYLGDRVDDRFRAVHSKRMTALKAISTLRNGKISYYVTCAETVRVGTRELLRFELYRPGLPPLMAEREIECVHPHDRETVPAKRKNPEPHVEAVSESSHATLWNQWNWNEKSVGRVVLKATKGSGIYVSVDNEHLKAALATRQAQPELRQAIEERYLAGVAFYLLLREVDREKGRLTGSDESGSDDIAELDRLARTAAALALPSEP